MNEQRRVESIRSIPRGDERSIEWFNEKPPELMWMVKIAVPFTYAFSKNHIYAGRGIGHVFLRKETRANQDSITLLLREALRDVEIKHNKLWIELLVQKPNQRGDAINVLDVICDGIKKATGIDDRWYSVRRIDWEIKKTDPQIFIGIGQERCEDSIICSDCGALKPLDQFKKNKSTPHVGVTRRCKQCLSHKSVTRL